MTYISQIEYDDAPKEVQRMYSGIEKARGLIFNNWKILAHAPHILRGYSQLAGSILNPEHVDRKLLNMAMLQVSLINKCYY